MNSKTYAGKTKIVLTLGDITEQATDAIVNAAIPVSWEEGVWTEPYTGKEAPI
jgi:hypothetical protein